MIREARYSDCMEVGSLKQRNGLSVKWSVDRWVGLWKENPAMIENMTLSLGWVLEYDNKIVGYLGNIPIHYWFQGRRLLATAARGFAVDEKYRSHSLRLIAAFFSQKNIDILLSTSANQLAGSVYKLSKAKKIPYPDYDKVLFWIINEQGFVGSYLQFKGYSKTLAKVVGFLLYPVIRFESLLNRRRPIRTASSCNITVLDPKSVSSEFDEFWKRILLERPQCLLAERSAEVLRWHFGHCAAIERQAKFVCAWRAGKLVGYLVLTREDSERTGLKRSRISDLLVENNAPDLIDALLNASIHQVRIENRDILELIGFPDNIRERFKKGNAHTRKLPSWLFWYKIINSELNDSLISKAAWYGSSYDGDASL